MNPIDSLFQRLRRENRRAFIPFVPAGDPDLSTTARLIEELSMRGAGLIEVGFPYSDPIADGPVIQASYTRALEKGLHIDDIFACLGQLKDISTPLVGMVSYSLVHRRGPKNFLEQALEAGLSGAIVPDLPWEEAEAFTQLATDHDFKLIQLVTPTTSKERATRIAKGTTGFLYCVSIAGITGERDRLPAELLEQLAWLRTQTELPLCVGFGISKPEHVRMLKDHADGVIVGSAIVRRLEEIGAKSAQEIIEEIGAYVEDLLLPLK